MTENETFEYFAERLDLFISRGCINHRIRLIEMFYGVLYSLKKASELNYSHMEKVTNEYNSSLIGLGKKLLDEDDMNLVWLSKYYFNNALSRLSSLYHRILKVIYYENICNCDAVKELNIHFLRKALKKELINIELKNINKVHNENNRIKHGLVSMTERNITFCEANLAFKELILLYEKCINC